ncbi:MAG: hypothetical protein MUE87_00720 [Methanothrix sp.]|nr:hypothetical protein [Methanothrix sp.]
MAILILSASPAGKGWFPLPSPARGDSLGAIPKGPRLLAQDIDEEVRLAANLREPFFLDARTRQ